MTNIPIKTTSFELGYGATHSEDLGITPKQLQAIPGNPNYFNEGVYVLSFTVLNLLPNYPGYFEAEIDFGTQELGSCDGWGTNAATQVTLVCPGPVYIVIDKELPGGGAAQGTKNLVIKFTVPNWQLSFTNVSFTFTPTN